MQSAQNIALSPDKSIIQIIERQYIIDSYDGVKDPIGMAGSRLEVEIAVIISPTAAIQNLYRSTQKINLPVIKACYNPLLAAEVVLFPVEMEMGIVFLNLGGGTTNISFFEKGSLLHTSVLPIGGDYITKDLAIVLKTSMQEAARIKEEYGLADVNLAKEDEIVTIHNIQGTDTKEVATITIAEIIAARVYEILELVFLEMERFGCIGKMPGGIVLTGGGAHLDGIINVIEEYLNIPVRLGLPDKILNLSNEFRDPQYANVLGALKCSAKFIDISYQEVKGVSKIVDRISYFFRDLFS